jgi:hypothetical protein
MMSINIVDLSALDDRVRDAMFFSDRVIWNNAKFALVVNNICGNKCLVRAFISQSKDTLLFVVYIPGSNSSTKLSSIVHVLQKRKEEDGCLHFEEGIALDYAKRSLIKHMEDSPPIIHAHHTYDSFTCDAKGHVTYPSNSFCPDPMRNYFMVYKGHLYEFDVLGATDQPHVHKVRVFKSIVKPAEIRAVAYSYKAEGVGDVVRVLVMTKSDPMLNVFFSIQDDSSLDPETNTFYMGHH